MNPDDKPLEPIDPPDDTGGGRIATEPDQDAAEAQALPIDPPDDTGGGR